MKCLFAVDSEAFLVSLESDSISDSGAKEHLSAAHEVAHYILWNGHECFLANEVEIDSVLGDYLNPGVSFHKCCKAFLIDHMVVLPSPLFCVFV